MITTGIQHYEQAFEGVKWGQLRLRRRISPLVTLMNHWQRG
jgi:hypothetical protein